MDSANETIQTLREAVRLAPNNIGLLEHLCRTLTRLGRYGEAEQEYREALRRMPQRMDLQLGLAETYYRQGKDSHALAIVETLVQEGDPPARALLLQARLLHRAGDVPGAVFVYQQAREVDEEAEDPELASLLGIGASEDEELTDGRLRAAEGGGTLAGDEPVEVERPSIRFDHVGGMESLKEEIRLKIIYPLEHADMYAAYGKAIGGGLLMYGPPGCGKTYLARATAGEVNASFLSVGISDILDMWIGQSEHNLKEVFQRARANTPCVLFFDEVDALGARRSDMRQSAGRHLINQFLAEMDGVDSDNEGVLILGATNAPWHIDSAFRRPGRFDRVLFVPPPDEAARMEILQILLQGKPTDKVDLQKLAAKTRDFSGADLKALVDYAVEQKLREAMKSGRPKPLTTSDLLAATKSVRSSSKEWFATARNYALYSNEGGLYDDILEFLKLKK